MEILTSTIVFSSATAILILTTFLDFVALGSAALAAASALDGHGGARVAGDSAGVSVLGGGAIRGSAHGGVRLQLTRPTRRPIPIRILRATLIRRQSLCST